MPIDILWPVFALVAWIFVVWFWMYVARFSLIRRQPPTAEDFASGANALRYFEPVEMPANNLRNLFEMPVLFLALVPLLMITHQAGHVQVALAWAFVGLRVVHSYVQIVVKRIPLRFMVYLASCAVLAAMWIGFFADLAMAR
ncbi:MAPEG family protein [Sphingomonas canadensis]|uniref:MAPEG family protein n=1 Tax=Sphingomonas canadensis TaxID=1219257 RepID=A0ABW3H5V8_9SPHN|nr:MAPEG family protein [Sphingomonas canadensis]MCW3836333.1 MAPEG family protein [Sphingomonas canadensis]